MSNLDNRISNADQLLTQDVEKFCDAVGELYSNLSKVSWFIFLVEDIDIICSTITEQRKWRWTSDWRKYACQPDCYIPNHSTNQNHSYIYQSKCLL